MQRIALNKTRKYLITRQKSCSEGNIANETSHKTCYTWFDGDKTCQTSHKLGATV